MIDKIESFFCMVGFGYVIYASAMLLGHLETWLETIVKKEHQELSIWQKVLYILCFLTSRFFAILLFITIVPIFIYGIQCIPENRIGKYYEKRINELTLENELLKNIAKRSPGNPYYDPMYF